jgi:sugar transferase (PEP-CTERM/EpsH1 system associated)
VKIFYLTPRVPFPIDKGDKLRAFHQIKLLSQKHEIYLFAIDENGIYDEKNTPLTKYCKGISVVPLSKSKIIINLFRGIFRSVPFQTSYYYSKKIDREIKDSINKFRPDIIFCQLIRAAKFVEDIKEIPKVIDYVDVISKGLERRISKSNLLMKILLKWEHKRALKYETVTARKFEKQIIITEEDKTQLNIQNKENIVVLPNGIDFEFFKPIEFQKKYDLFFTGNLSYPPNVIASEYLVKQIMPLVWRRNPKINLLVAGASPKKRILSLASDKVHAMGWADDIRDYYKTAKVFIAPLQIGTGLQNKLLQAMAMKLPCVVSELTAKGLSNGNSDFILIANEPDEYVNHILKLLEDQEYASAVAQKGFEFVREHFNWNNIISNLELLLSEQIKK